jgi:hypothetical protein
MIKSGFPSSHCEEWLLNNTRRRLGGVDERLLCILGQGFASQQRSRAEGSFGEPHCGRCASEGTGSKDERKAKNV